MALKDRSTCTSEGHLDSADTSLIMLLEQSRYCNTTTTTTITHTAAATMSFCIVARLIVDGARG
jgi:hypothetical protein